MKSRARLALLATASLMVATSAPGQQQIVARAPTGVTPEAERLLASSVEPRRLRLIEGDDAVSVARRTCGRLTETYLALLEQANARPGTESGIAVLPACFVTRLAETVKVAQGETWATLATRVSGAAGTKTLKGILPGYMGRIVSPRQVRSAGALAIPADIEEVSVPVTTEAVAYTPKAGLDPAALASQLRVALEAPNSPGLAPTLPQPTDELTLEAGVPPGVQRAPVCPAARRTETSWPFPVDEVMAVIGRNEAHSGTSPRPAAVIAVVDNGVDGLLGPAFPIDDFEVIPLERNFPSDHIDQDGNGYFDDVVGTNIYEQGSPIAYAGALSPSHGTMMAALALGGADFRRKWAATAKPAPVRLRPISIVKRATVPSTAGNVTTYPMPTESIAKAIDYADTSQATIVNLSVSTPNRLSGVEDALYNRSNLLLIVAAGNAATDLDAVPRYPATLSMQDSGYRGRVVTVAAHDRAGCLSGFSGRGADTVDLAAPGAQITATGLAGVEITDEGTSQATAIVSFTAGNLRAAGLSTASAIKERLIASVDLSPAMHGQVRSDGMLDVPKALSISEDVLELASATGRTYGHLSQRPDLGAVCPSLVGDPRQVLKVSRRVDGGDPTQVRVLVRVLNKRGATKPVHCTPSAATVNFTALDGRSTTFTWPEVLDLVPAV